MDGCYGCDLVAFIVIQPHGLQSKAPNRYLTCCTSPTKVTKYMHQFVKEKKGLLGVNEHQLN